MRKIAEKGKRQDEAYYYFLKKDQLKQGSAHIKTKKDEWQEPRMGVRKGWVCRVSLCAL